MDPLKDFHLVAFDFLKIIAYKRANKQDREADALENFYDVMLNLVTRAGEELHTVKLVGMTEHFKAKILESELKRAYNEVFKKDQKLAADLIANTSMLTRKQINEEVRIK